MGDSPAKPLSTSKRIKSTMLWHCGQCPHVASALRVADLESAKADHLQWHVNRLSS